VVSALTAWWLIPSGGLRGALWAYALATFIVYAALIVVTIRDGSLTLPLGSITRLTIAAIGAGAVAGSLLLWSTSLWTQFAAGCLYGLLFPVFTLMLRAWRESELAVIAQQSHRLGRFGGLIDGIGRWGIRGTTR
jgi:hypothetical protein